MSARIKFRCATHGVPRNLSFAEIERRGMPECPECRETMHIEELPPGPWLLKCEYPEYIVPEGKNVVCLGELRNMKGHYVMVDQRGKLYPGLHLDAFRLVVPGGD